jgi:hypothetical protein
LGLEERIGRDSRTEQLECHMDEVKPGASYRLVISAGQRVAMPWAAFYAWTPLRIRQSASSKDEAGKIQIGNLEMSPMVPMIKWAED